jgi:biopolymer transport protein ExbB
MRLNRSWIAATALVITIGVYAIPSFAASLPTSQPQLLAAGFLPTWVFRTFDYIVLGMLTCASIGGIALAIDAMLHIRESRIAPPSSTAKIRSLIENQKYKELMDYTATDDSFVSKALYAAIRRTHFSYDAMQEALEASIGEQTSDLFRRLEPLNVIGNIGPLLGLLGTVLGMIMAFYELMNSGGNAKPEQLAGGIGTALWHTFYGLFVAIPCLVVYGFYRTKADRITTRAGMTAEELLEDLRPETPDDSAPLKSVRALTEGAV